MMETRDTSLKHAEPRLTILMDVPSPYRTHFFNSLTGCLAEHDLEFEVLFMAETVPIRHWNLDKSKLKFKYAVCRGFHFHFGQTSFHLNLGIVWSILRSPPKWLLVGGSWNIPTVILCLLTQHIFRGRGQTIMWSEANFRSSSKGNFLVNRIRKWLLSGVDAFAVPGEVAAQTIFDHWHIPHKPILHLPNLVDEMLFKEKVSSLRIIKDELRKGLGFSSEDLLFLWPARLHENTKGLLNFLSAIADSFTENVKIMIAGEGEDRRRIECWIKEASLCKNITLLGQKSEQDMLSLYAIADGFLLPSLKDPNPLSVIEALWAGLPILISINCGNYIEAVDEEINGWVIDPADKNAMRTAFEKLINLTLDERKLFGLRSIQIAELQFATQVNVQRFLNELRNEFDLGNR
jgi:glycosyltransferase involved in cell wall biosynthesis